MHPSFIKRRAKREAKVKRVSFFVDDSQPPQLLTGEQLRTQVHILRFLEEFLDISGITCLHSLCLCVSVCVCACVSSLTHFHKIGVRLQPWVVIIKSTKNTTQLGESVAGSLDEKLVRRLEKMKRQYGGRMKKITKKVLRQEQPFEESDIEGIQPKIKTMNLLDGISPFSHYKSFLLSDDSTDIDDCIAGFDSFYDPRTASYFSCLIWAKALIAQWTFSSTFLVALWCCVALCCVVLCCVMLCCVVLC